MTIFDEIEERIRFINCENTEMLVVSSDVHLGMQAISENFMEYINPEYRPSGCFLTFRGVDILMNPHLPPDTIIAYSKGEHI